MTIDPAGPEDAEVIFEQAGARRSIETVPLAHVSVELGHLYPEDYAAGADRLREHFASVAPWLRAVTDGPHLGGPVATTDAARPRLSTCYLVDDYSGSIPGPSEILPGLLAAAEENGITIDYLARAAACADWRGLSLARIVEGHIVPEPPPGSNGGRPPAQATGWLSNGVRSPTAELMEAMRAVPAFTPPRETSRGRHSVFVDVELWDERDGQRRWSCAFLASVWQMMRLGLVRERGMVPAPPTRWTDAWPRQWSDLPPVIQLSAQPKPFAAYSTFSILGRRYLPVETAVRTILEQVAVAPTVAAQVRTRAADEMDPVATGSCGTYPLSLPLTCVANRLRERRHGGPQPRDGSGAGHHRLGVLFHRH